MTSGVICTAGITAKINAELNNLPFIPNVVKISNQLLSCDGTETSLPGIVWNVPSNDVTQMFLDTGTMRTIIYMDLSVGDFGIATIGIFDSISGVLFALAAFPGAGSKLAYNPPAQAGNIRTFYIDLAYNSNSVSLEGNISNISLITIQQALASANGSVTARQLRTALNNLNYLDTVEAAISSASPDNQAVIDWATCAATTMGSSLLNFIAYATSQSDSGAGILAAATRLPA